MVLSLVIQNAVKDCVGRVVSSIRKQVELEFNKDNHHKSGRSGCHGKKFNIISQTIIRNKNDNTFLTEQNLLIINDKNRNIKYRKIN